MIVRKKHRLKNYDYSQNGAYFITICAKDRKNIFSEIIANDSVIHPFKTELTKIGFVAEKGISNIENHYENVFVDKYVIMPNHIHLIIRIDNENGLPTVTPTISRIIQQYKGFVSKQLSESIWQKLFYDHIIRNDEDYITKWQYIDDNPAKWFEDELYRK